MTTLIVALFLFAGGRSPAERALDAQDRAALERTVAELTEAAERASQEATAHYRVAVANSLLAQLAIETGDKALGRSAAEAGIRAAQQAVALDGNHAEYRRILGTLCGQVIPANVMAGLKYGKCAMEEVNRAIELDPNSSEAWLSRGVGNYYLPPAFGGGVDKAIEDVQKAIQLNPKSAEAHLWLGIALRKAGRTAEARKALAAAVKLNPERKWARQQLEKTPAQ